MRAPGAPQRPPHGRGPCQPCPPHSKPSRVPETTVLRPVSLPGLQGARFPFTRASRSHRVTGSRCQSRPLRPQAGFTPHGPAADAWAGQVPAPHATQQSPACLQTRVGKIWVVPWGNWNSRFSAPGDPAQPAAWPRDGAVPGGPSGQCLSPQCAARHVRSEQPAAPPSGGPLGACVPGAARPAAQAQPPACT